MIYKKFPNENGIYRDKTTGESFDLLEAEIRFYCPSENCGHAYDNTRPCSFSTNDINEAINHYNLELK